MNDELRTMIGFDLCSDFKCCIPVTPQVRGGHVDSSIRLISADGAKTLEIARGHYAPVTCLAISPDSNYLVTGSRDATVLLWRIHRSSISRSSSSPDPSINSGTPTSTSTPVGNNLADKSKWRRIEGPLHVLRDVLLHSIRRGRLVRRLFGVEAHSVCLSSDGIIIIWNKYLCTLSTFTVNGTPISKNQLPLSSSVSCIEHLKSVNSRSADHELNEGNRLDLPLPSICFFDLYSLKVLHTMKLADGQDITSIALNEDNTNLLVSTANKQLIIFTDPSVADTVDEASILLNKRTSIQH
ncbi:BEACH domain-containing protein C2 [Sesamum angolense]|uniref:BEACH domain-containing protein C2 n=1 Tax=Sesamum angolense TaxID=2727404 RepID=A0AAE1XH75_9LAMI|nr:BEACH domain-containing protein C2 [Sesamum angolense]